MIIENNIHNDNTLQFMGNKIHDHLIWIKNTEKLKKYCKIENQKTLSIKKVIKKFQMIKLISLKTNKIKKKQINDILLLKDQHWKFGIKSQINNFKKNFHKSDINNCLYLKDELIGYTALKLRSFSYNKNKYFLFDTLIIKKKYRRKNYSLILMDFNNFIIKNNNKISFLICDKKMIKFYKNHNWKTLNKNKVIFSDFKTNKIVMSYNYLNKTKPKSIYLNLKK